MRYRAALKMLVAAVTAAAVVLCFGAPTTPSVALIFIASFAVIVSRPFGKAPNAGHLDQLNSDLGQARRGVERIPRTNASVSSTVMAIPEERTYSQPSPRFALLFRDEIVSAKWRSLATRLRMQRGQARASQ